MSELEEFERELRQARDLKARQAEAVGHINGAIHMAQALGFPAQVILTRPGADLLSVHVSFDLFPAVADDPGPVELVEPFPEPKPETRCEYGYVGNCALVPCVCRKIRARQPMPAFDEGGGT